MPARKSALEEILVSYLIANFPEIVIIQRSRAIKKTRSGKSRYEIDVYLPELRLGFEVQDFATHSKGSDQEKGHPWRRNGLKNGPKLHELKRRLAKEQLHVDIVDIWEDELRSGEFKRLVSEQINSRCDRI